MHSQQIDVSYFAAGIFAHLCCDGIKCWSYTLIDLNTILDELVSDLKFQINLNIYNKLNIFSTFR